MPESQHFEKKHNVEIPTHHTVKGHDVTAHHCVPISAKITSPSLLFCNIFTQIFKTVLPFPQEKYSVLRNYNDVNVPPYLFWSRLGSKVIPDCPK